MIFGSKRIYFIQQRFSEFTMIAPIARQMLRTVAKSIRFAVAETFRFDAAYYL